MRKVIPEAAPDTIMTPVEFCLWQKRSYAWWKRHKNVIPGVIKEAGGHWRIHTPTYLAAKLAAKKVKA